MRILDQIDKFLDNQKENEAKLFFFLPILLFGFLSYYLIYPITNQDLKNSLDKYDKLQKNINKFNNEISNFNRGNARLKLDIAKINQDLKVLHKDKIKYDELVRELKFLRFDLVEWAKFYKTIPLLAKKHHIYIYQLDNMMDDSKTDQLIQKKMTIIISASGDFVDFIKFMMEFEKLKEFVKITSIEMTSNDLKLTIDIYGAQL